MKSIKRGRGPSFMDGMASAFGCVFGVFWTIMAFSMGAPIPFCCFGVLFVIIGVFNAWYSFHNAKSENRFSEFDIVEHGEEDDPLNDRFGVKKESKADVGENRFCPFCGAAAAEDFKFCNNCGRKLP